MNTTIVYDSLFSNTEQIAQAIADALSEYGQVRTVPVAHTHPLELAGVDVLILGCPTQKWNATPAMRSLLQHTPLESLKKVTVACFDTRFGQPQWLTGSAAKQMTSMLHKLGVSCPFPPISFLVKGLHGPMEEGEFERAANWAHRLYILWASDQLALKP